MKSCSWEANKLMGAMFPLPLLTSNTIAMKQKVNEIHISYRDKLRITEAPEITSSHMAAELLHNQWNKDTIALQESFKVLLLNNANKVKGCYEVSKGGITGTLVNLRILFAIILKSLSVGIILAHNHPSGTLKPSHADKQLTQKIQKVAILLDVRVLDHIILAPNGSYFSFADNDLL